MEAITERRPPLIPWIAYNALGVPGLLAGMHLGRLFEEKAGTGIEGRRRLFERLQTRREALQGCLWVHASSAGEVEQARPLLREARRRLDPSRPILLTVYSPAGLEHARARAEADLVEYLPFDTLRASDRMLRWLRPSALVFVRYDCWPNLVWAARSSRVPLLLLSATLGAGSRRSNRLLQSFFASVLKCFDHVGCRSEEDRAAFLDRFDLEPGRVEVTGDTRYDQVLQRGEEAERSPLVELLRQQPWRYGVLGSTWEADHREVLGPMVEDLRRHGERGWIVVPHEPTPNTLGRLEEQLASSGIESTRLSQLVEPTSQQRRSTAAAREETSWRVILVDAVGILAELYHAAELAYVGGGFGAGVHSVLEPAAASAAVLFGPRHERATEAADLLEAGGAHRIHGGRDLRRQLEAWPPGAEELATAGRRARARVETHAGATDRNLSLLERALADRAAQR